MIITVLQIAVLAAYVIALPLLARYLYERIKNIARESTEKALKDYDHQHQKSLSDYGHQHQQALAALNATNQRRIHEYGLFTQRQHVVYAKLYARFRMASDGFAKLVGFMWEPKFANYSKEEILAYMKRRDVTDSDASTALVHEQNGDKERMAEALSDLHWKLNRRDAERAFVRAKNYEALNELYLSNDVRNAVSDVRRCLASVSVAVMREDGERDKQEYEKSQEAQGALAKLFHVMRDELRRGDEPAGAS